MRGPTYRYDTVTCRYERSRISFKGASMYVLGVAITAFFFLAALLILHDFLFSSNQEIAYQKENKVLQKNELLLLKELEDVEATLSLLKEKDKQLHEKFFAQISNTPNTNKKTKRQHDILLSNAKSFRKTAGTLETKVDALFATILEKNPGFSLRNEIANTKYGLIESLPLLQPIRNLAPQQLISGYGVRINPFHKGLYKHTGVDIALPRGTEIIATAPGKIITTKISTVEAGYGNYIEIDHGHGLITRYAHLEEIKVRAGQNIEKGVVIATSGNSGGSIAPHLHYEIIREGKAVDPIDYMIEKVEPQLYNQLKQFSQQQNQSLD
ncbi:M23 family metallopeptidase [Chryseosolibacter indicus]|uniref:M23 family metallopeptidase n=1 Tax=Chryseosolibacter indicus TaxID=2782351 RepID=A0ABS5VUT1_9BACT|nr:M23 family metallopeptidase [Chryseosolibacter indicus]MBT1705195.1 M23 family metallopeptidase [Chryseosolibacter indicus]